MLKKQQSVEIKTLCHHVLLYCDVAIGIYEMIDKHCSSQCYIGGNSCKCKYFTLFSTPNSYPPPNVILIKMQWLFSIIKQHLFSKEMYSLELYHATKSVGLKQESSTIWIH
jgi:hypothetical protein